MEEKIKNLNIMAKEDAIIFVKSLIIEEPLDCPLCGGTLTHFHKKAKKNNIKWICKDCDRRYDVTHLLNEISD